MLRGLAFGLVDDQRRVHGGPIPVERLGFEPGLDCFARVGSLDEVDTLITDEGLDAALAIDLQAAGSRVVIA